MSIFNPPPLSRQRIYTAPFHYLTILQDILTKRVHKGGDVERLEGEISRMTGSGKMKFYIVSDEEYQKVAVKFATRMRAEGLDNFDDKSFDSARRKIIVQTKIEHFKDKKVTDTVKFKCEKIEGKKF